jgi:hypothetical protein
MPDRDGNRSNPYHPNPEHCCEACAFGRGDHAAWCGLGFEPTPALPSEEETTLSHLSAPSAYWCEACAFGQGEHAAWCQVDPPVAGDNDLKAALRSTLRQTLRNA